MIHVYLSETMEPIIHKVLEVVTRRKTTLENVKWWNAAAPYPFLFLAIHHILSPASEVIGALSILLVFILSYGFMIRLLNDRFDITSDAEGGKENLYSSTNQFWLDSLVVVFAIMVVFIWIPWSENPLLTMFLGTLVPISGLLYSHRLIRLKEKGFWAPLVDSAYAFVFPSAIIISIGGGGWFILLGSCAFLWIYGMPNMLYHHLSDIDHDAKSNTQTFGRSYPDLSKKMIKGFSLIIVLSIFSALVYAASEILDHAYIFWIVFGLLGWVEFTVTNRSLPSYLLWIYTKWFMARQVLFAFFMCYAWQEGALLLFGAGLVLFGQLYWWRLAHLLRGVVGIYKGVSHLTRQTYFFVRKVCSFGVNHSIYWFFRLFGVDLKVLNTSALGYLKSHLKGFKKRDA